MSFEPRKTKLTIFSLNHELHNLIKSAFDKKFDSKSTQTYTFQSLGEELIYSFLKV